MFKNLFKKRKASFDKSLEENKKQGPIDDGDGPCSFNQEIKDMLLSDYFRAKGWRIVAIEPIAHENWDENGYYISLEYDVWPVIEEGAPESTTCPYRWLIDCKKKIYQNIVGDEVIQLLWTKMAQDLKIRIFNEMETPVCISVIIDNKEITL